MGRLRSLAALLCVLLTLSLGVLGKKKNPQIDVTPFNSIPTNLFYFDDSDVVLVGDPEARTTYRSTDAGVSWKPLAGVESGQVLEVLRHPYNNKIALVIGLENDHWITKDRGESWKKFSCEGLASLQLRAINFHAEDPDRMLFLSADRPCFGFDCNERVYYTTNGFDTDPKLLHKSAVSCIWAKSTDLFATGSSASDQDRVLCIAKGTFNPFRSNNRLLTSDDYFETAGVEPLLEDGRTVPGIVNLAAVKSYIVAAAKSEGTKELAMYVTDDAKSWHRAEFGEHKLEEDAYTLLESTNYSMQVDVLNTRTFAPMGVLLTSNSNGTYFRKNIEHTNRNTRGFVDFEKIQNIQGIVMVNTVDNWKEVEQGLEDKKIISQISFNDGRTWESLLDDDGDGLHLHSVTEQRNVGRIFSSPAPGIVMGVGNTGNYLRPYDEGDTYVSDDAGLTWKKALDKPHLYEFGDQGALLVAVEDGETDHMKWSLNHGEDWQEIPFAEDLAQPISLTTVPDSTSPKFILTVSKGRGNKKEYFIVALDFSTLDVDTCKKSDFEEWSARVDGDGQPTCIMGHTQTFRRRKADKKCFVNVKFRDPLPESEDCKCTDEDYECDHENGFTRKGNDCVLTGVMKPDDDACRESKGKKDTYTGPSGYQLVPGNTCVKKGGVVKDEPVERSCKELQNPIASGKITNKLTKFTGDAFMEYFYLERVNSNRGEETVIMRTDERAVYVTHDHGKKWEQVFSDDQVVAIYPHQYINDNVYLITPNNTVFYSYDFADHWQSFTAPEAPNQDHLAILGFHPQQKDWLIWTGVGECDSGQCPPTAQVSTKGGMRDSWKPLLRAVRKCQFVYREGRVNSDQLIYCEQYVNEDPSGTLSLLSSVDWFERQNTLKEDVINFATMSEFIVVAVRDANQQSLQVDTSIDGQVFADAKFPPNFNVPHQQAYTVLDSSTHAVFLHVTVNNKEGQEYGSIVKSNSNGTSYVLSVDDVNRNSAGYVDFEKMQGLEGVAIINRVSNSKEVGEGSKKLLKTYITHNDGADWDLITRPKDPPNGDAFKCKGYIEQCSLHLHGYTERRDARDTYSSASAVGLMIATGNVGEFLGPKKEANTFATRDGGVTWQMVAPGNWMWEYGDQGSIIVIVKEDIPTNNVLYSLNEGRDWIDYQFSGPDMIVTDITTVPSDTSRNFILWGRLDGDLVSINLDFSGLTERNKECILDEAHPDTEKGDYDLWSPSHPNMNNNCLFGHVAQYHRKKADRDCYNGKNIKKLHAIEKNCTCTRSDFECDYNYERQKDGSCKLVEGLQPADPKAICTKDPNAVEYTEITGYRRIPLTTCQGGKELDLTARTLPCPNHEDEYRSKHGLSAAGLFFAIVIPIAAAAGIGYWVWKNWESKFGRIRLGGAESDSSGFSASYNALDRDAPWVKFPVMAVSGMVAVLAAVPMLVSSLWSVAATRFGRGRGGYSRPYASRNSFARGRGDYAIVDEDEGELLGDDSDEDV